MLTIFFGLEATFWQIFFDRLCRRVSVPPNKVQGPYESAEEYIHTQFKLLRCSPRHVSQYIVYL